MTTPQDPFIFHRDLFSCDPDLNRIQRPSQSQVRGHLYWLIDVRKLQCERMTSQSSISTDEATPVWIGFSMPSPFCRHLSRLCPLGTKKALVSVFLLKLQFTQSSQCSKCCLTHWSGHKFPFVCLSRAQKLCFPSCGSRHQSVPVSGWKKQTHIFYMNKSRNMIIEYHSGQVSVFKKILHKCPCIKIFFKAFLYSSPCSIQSSPPKVR